MTRRAWKIGWAGALAAALLLGIGVTLTPVELPELAVPSRIYASAARIAVGEDLERSEIVELLRRLGYRELARGDPRPGEFRRERRRLLLNRRPFRTPGASGAAGLIELRVDSNGRISAIRGEGGRRLPSVLLEPEVIGAFHSEQREDRYLIPLQELPVALVDAVLAIEDRRFFVHSGLDLRRLVGAAIANLRARRVVQGGSTLTQQLVKNVFLSDERTLARKLPEAWLALRVERGHQKEEILEAYLNTIYMGQRGSVSVRGMEAAARHYFGKHARELSLAESALLAGLIRGPGLYSPFGEPEAARERRNQVLAILYETGRISETQYREASALPLGNLPEAPDSVSAPYFSQLVARELREDLPELALEDARVAVHTGLDARLQRAAQRAVARGLARLEADFPHLTGRDPLQAALVAMDPSSGDLRALVGGRDFQHSQFDRASFARRQPGSVFKPVVALSALSPMNGEPPPFTLASQIEDQPLRLETPEGVWEPANYDGEFRGTVSLREALEQSINVPFARLGLLLGPPRIIATARRMGIEAVLEPLPSLALGAFELTPLEIAQSYAVLASSGQLVLPRSYQRVIDIDGRELVARRPERSPRFDPAAVGLVTSALRGAVERGTGRGVRSAGYRGPLAGKTGTTNDFRDAWFVGYTPELVTVVWVGFDDGRSLGLTGSRAALPLFAEFIRQALGPWGGGEFPEPAGLERVEIHAPSGLRAGLGCPGEPEWFLAGTAPRESCGPSWPVFSRERRPRETQTTVPDRPSRSAPGWVRILEGVLDALEEAVRESR